jgi:phosphohistidine phosphatase
MTTLLLLRHAKSSWEDPKLPDHERPLNRRGREAAAKVGRVLKEHSLSPELILSSTARRAVATAELVRDSGGAPPIETFRRLYLAEPEVYLEVLRSYDRPPERVMLVGHNPGLEALLSTWLGRSEPMPTAALACLRFPDASFRDLTLESPVELFHFWKPRELDD